MGIRILSRDLAAGCQTSSPSVVVSISIQEGDVVKVGDRLCTLEAMKMEMGVFSPEAGRVKEILCRPNQQVAIAQPLILLEAEEEAEQEQTEQSYDLPEVKPRPLMMLFEGDQAHPEKMDKLSEDDATLVIDDLTSMVRSVMLGFDIREEQLVLLEKIVDAHSGFQELSKPERWSSLVEALNIFADCEMLLDRNLFMNVEDGPAVPADMCFYDYCRRHNEGEKAVLESFSPLLGRTLSWYGVDFKEPSEELKMALWRLCIARQHTENRHRLCSSILRIMIQLYKAGLETVASTALKETLGRIAQTARKEFPFLRDNALQAQYALFHQQKYALRVKSISALLANSFSGLKTLNANEPETRMAMNGGS